MLLKLLQLTVMPSLEILDISRNKVKRLPSQPGSLVNLRVCLHGPGLVNLAKCALARFSAFSATKSHASQGILQSLKTLTS